MFGPRAAPKSFPNLSTPKYCWNESLARSGRKHSTLLRQDEWSSGRLKSQNAVIGSGDFINAPAGRDIRTSGRDSGTCGREIRTCGREIRTSGRGKREHRGGILEVPFSGFQYAFGVGAGSFRLSFYNSTSLG